MSRDPLTQSVVRRHWDALLAGDLVALMADYADDAILITGVTGIVKGHAAIGELLTVFVTQILPPATTHFDLDKMLIEGRLGYITWRAESATHRIGFSSDTFVVEAGKITLQTSAGALEPKVN